MFMTFTIRFDDTTGNKRPWEIICQNDKLGTFKVVGSCASEEGAVKSASKWVKNQNDAYGKIVARLG